MAAGKRLICASVALEDGGDGIRFEVGDGVRPNPAFAVRYRGRVYAYLNRCAHVPVEMDWMEGKFFDMSGHMLICAVHGAHYDPRNGRCLMGPCKGASLKPLAIVEDDGKVYLIEQ